MKMQIRIAVLVALVATACNAPAAEPARGTTAAEVARILQDAGYPAKVGEAGGDPRIDSNMAGVDVVVDFYDCEADRCGSLRFTTALDLETGTTYQAANAFTLERWGAAAVVDERRSPAGALAGWVTRLMRGDEVFVRMRRVISTLARPDSARHIVEDWASWVPTRGPAPRILSASAASA